MNRVDIRVRWNNELSQIEDEDLKKLSIYGENGIKEIVANIPLIGMTDSEKEKYYEKINNTLTF